MDLSESSSKMYLEGLSCSELSICFHTSKLVQPFFSGQHVNVSMVNLFNKLLKIFSIETVSGKNCAVQLLLVALLCNKF